MLPKQAVSFKQLREEGVSSKEITALYAGLKLFPTPFKGIYYVPLAEERKGELIEKPLKVLSQAVGLFLETKDFYFSCRTAEEALGISWRPSGSVHLVNTKLSRKIDLKSRTARNKNKENWRSKKIARLLSFYGNEIVFHKTKSFRKAKIRQTPYGRFATKQQIRIDRTRFGCNCF